MPSVAERVMRIISLFMRSKLVKRMSVPTVSHPFWGRVSPPGNVLGARSGMTRARLSPGGIVTRLANEWRTVVGSPDAHVAFLEEGGTKFGTSPKGFLRIPTRAMQTAAGVDRLTGASARTLPGAFFLRSKAGNLWIAIRDRGQRPTLLYLLKKSVRQRGRHIFRLVTAEVNAEAPRIANLQVAAFARRVNA